MRSHETSLWPEPEPPGLRVSSGGVPTCFAVLFRQESPVHNAFPRALNVGRLKSADLRNGSSRFSDAGPSKKRALDRNTSAGTPGVAILPAYNPFEPTWKS
jgi:hypothetical protein